MRIAIKGDGWGWPEYIAVIVNGSCNHGGELEYEQVENEEGWLTQETFCDKCGAWFNELDNKFYDGREV